MIVIPAIDLRQGRCVRMVEGKLATERVVAEDPIAQALAFERDGAERIHVVDLDGAFGGASPNRPIIEAIVRAVRVPVEVGGGLRDEETITRVLDAGAAYAIVGTMAAKNPDVLGQVCRRHPGRIIAGVDAAGGKVAVDGWVDRVEMTAPFVAARAERLGACAIITTEISRDGTGLGADVAGSHALAEELSIPVIASGGVHDLGDIERLRDTAVFGVVVGRAIYDGTLDLRAAILAAKGG